MSVVISVRVPRWVKEKLEEHGVNIAELIREKLIEEARRLEDRWIDKELEEIGSILAERIDPYEFAEIIDEERRAR